MSKEMFKCVDNLYVDEAGRIIIFDLKCSEEQITIVGIYAPNDDLPVFFEQLGRLLEMRSQHKIIVGDYNLALEH